MHDIASFLPAMEQVHAALADHEADVMGMRAAMDAEDALRARWEHEETSPHASPASASSFEQVRDVHTWILQHTFL